MESYGALLKAAREEKKLSLDTIEIETSISKEYLDALENENTSFFHGEAYVVGFLRNYADYLDLDSTKLINLYKNMMIQESPVPEGLIEKPKPVYFIPSIIFSCIGVVIVAFAIFYFGVYRKKMIEKENAYAISEKNQQKIHELSDKPINARVYIGDQIVVPAKDGNVILTVVNDINSKLALSTPIGIQYFELSETRELDIDGDAVSDFVLDVWEISANEQSRGAEIYMVHKDETSLTEVVDNTSVPLQQKVSADHVVVHQDNRSYPFTLDASFRKPCVFRYEVDRKNSVENFYDNGDVVTMTANNRVRVWIANGNTVKLKVIAASQTFELEIGKAGECIVEDLKWILAEDGKYKLVVEQVE